MNNQANHKKPRIFELWDQIFGADKQEDEAAQQGGIKRNGRQ